MAKIRIQMAIKSKTWRTLRLLFFSFWSCTLCRRNLLARSFDKKREREEREEREEKREKRREREEREREREREKKKKKEEDETK
jgi:hypothetical protein